MKRRPRAFVTNVCPVTRLVTCLGGECQVTTDAGVQHMTLLIAGVLVCYAPRSHVNLHQHFNHNDKLNNHNSQSTLCPFINNILTPQHILLHFISLF